MATVLGRRRSDWTTLEFWNVCLFSPDGKILARFVPNEGSHSSLEVEFWDVQTGKRILILPRQRSLLRNCVFSPDARAVALVTDAGNIYIFDVASGQKKCSMINEKTYQGFLVASSFPFGVIPSNP